MKKSERIWLGFVCLIFLGSLLEFAKFAGEFDLFLGKNIALEIPTARFPGTTGTITQSTMSVHPDGDDTFYRWDLAYRYEVDGQTFTGTRYWNDCLAVEESVKDTSPAWVRRFATKHPVGMRVKVFYNPKDPGDSLLVRGVGGSELAGILCATPFNLLGLMLVWALWFMARRAFPPPQAGGVRIVREGSRLRVRMAFFTPLALGLAVTGSLAFLLCIPIELPFWLHPPAWLAASGLVMAYGAGFAAAIMQWRKLALSNLIIDEERQTLQLPRTRERKESRTLGFAEIAAVRVDTSSSKDLYGQPRYRFTPSLYLRDGNAPVEKLKTWNEDRPKAEAFGSWLRERLRLPPDPVKAIKRPHARKAANFLGGAAAPKSMLKQQKTIFLPKNSIILS